MERPPTRCSVSRFVPAPGAAITGHCPASHAPPCYAPEEKPFDFFASCILLSSSSLAREDYTMIIISP